MFKFFNLALVLIGFALPACTRQQSGPAVSRYRPHSTPGYKLLSSFNSEPVEQCRARLQEKYLSSGLYNSDADPCAIVKIKTGFSHLCIQTADGKLTCQKLTLSREMQANLVVPQDLEPIRDLEVAGLYACAILVSNKIRCWSADGVAPQPGAIAGQIKRLFLSNTQTGKGGCATTDQGISCWGEQAKTLPESVRVLTDVDEIAFDGQNVQPDTFCTLRGGLVQCGSSLLGYGKSFPPGDPRGSVLSGVPADLKNPRELDIFAGRVCANTDDGIRCWGRPADPNEDRGANLRGIAAMFRAGGQYCGFDDAGKLACALADEKFAPWLANVNSLPRVRQAVAAGGNLCVLSDFGVSCGPNEEVQKIEMPSASVLRLNVQGFANDCAYTKKKVVCWDPSTKKTSEFPALHGDFKFTAATSVGDCVMAEQGLVCLNGPPQERVREPSYKYLHNGSVVRELRGAIQLAVVPRAHENHDIDLVQALVCALIESAPGSVELRCSMIDSRAASVATPVEVPAGIIAPRALAAGRLEGASVPAVCVTGLAGLQCWTYEKRTVSRPSDGQFQGYELTAKAQLLSAPAFDPGRDVIASYGRLCGFTGSDVSCWDGKTTSVRFPALDSTKRLFSLWQNQLCAKGPAGAFLCEGSDGRDSRVSTLIQEMSRFELLTNSGLGGGSICGYNLPHGQLHCLYGSDGAVLTAPFRFRL